MDQLLKPTDSLECLSKGDFDSQVARLSAYGLRSEADFDKYSALSMVQSVAREAHRLSHKASGFLQCCRTKSATAYSGPHR